jgi:hypothetical protein
METGRELVIYARNEKAARALVADRQTRGEQVAAVGGKGPPLLLRDLGGIVSVREEVTIVAKLVTDARKAPGS